MFPLNCQGIDLSWTKIGDRRAREVIHELSKGCAAGQCLTEISYLDLSRCNIEDGGVRVTDCCTRCGARAIPPRKLCLMLTFLRPNRGRGNSCHAQATRSVVPALSDATFPP